jgi:hypothetical protein
LFIFPAIRGIEKSDFANARLVGGIEKSDFQRKSHFQKENHFSSFRGA